MERSNIFQSQMESHVEEILRHAPADFTANMTGHFSPEDMEWILSKARAELAVAIHQSFPQSYTELALLWHQVVVDFYQKDRWGFVPGKKRKAPVKGPHPNQKLISYMRTFLVPTLLLKAGILYCGLNYSQYPGEGYGWGLIATISLSLCNFALFLWKSRNDGDEL